MSEITLPVISILQTHLIVEMSSSKVMMVLVVMQRIFLPMVVVVRIGNVAILYHYGNQKLNTTGYGVSVTGGINVSGISTLGTVKISSGIVTASSGIVTYYGDGSNLTGVSTFGNHFSEQQNSSSPNNTVPVNALSAIGTETNIDVALLPKGSGAILADIPDGLTPGGNKRGSLAVDLQMSRLGGTAVASGNYSALIGGRHNTASGSQFLYWW